MELRIKSLPVSEKNYEETMLNTVEPFLAKNGEQGFFNSFDGKKIHYEKYVVPGNRASIAVVHGFTESAEKFREMSYCFLLMGYNVFALDQRGHGLSYRINKDPETVTIDRFDTYVKDLDCFVCKVIKPASEGLPLYVYCHSMGGAVTVQYLQSHPGVFKKAVLSAPMIMPQCGMPPKAALALTGAFCALGQKNRMVFVYNGFDREKTYEKSHDTSKARFDYYQAKRLKNRYLQTASASYRWVVEAVKVSSKNLNPLRNKNIYIPVLLCQPEEDSSVFSEKEDEFIMQIPDGRIEHFENCRHEIYMSFDDTVFKYLQTIEKFLGE